MSNYSKTTDFAAKDALLTGDPNKIVKGTEINDEFDAIQTAVNSKANNNNSLASLRLRESMKTLKRSSKLK